MKKLCFGFFVVFLLIQSCVYGGYKAEEEVRTLQNKLDSVERWKMEVECEFEGDYQELFDMLPQQDTAIIKVAEKLYNNVYLNLGRFDIFTDYQDFEFECY